MKKIFLACLFLVMLTTSTLLVSKPVFADAKSECLAAGGTPAECNNSTGAYDQNKIPSPENWLGKLTVDNIPSGNIDIVSENIVPFAINILFFLILLASLIMLIVGGITWITSGGEKEAMTKAKGTITYALIGLVLGLASFLILNTIGYLFGLTF